MKVKINQKEKTMVASLWEYPNDVQITFFVCDKDNKNSFNNHTFTSILSLCI